VGAAIRSLVRRRTIEVHAVAGISFEVKTGQILGFLGPNGAGKTTTLKILSGLLFPSTGQVRVLGYEPSRRERDFLRQITLVMGQRSQLVWDIPALDSFELNREIYRIPPDVYRSALRELTDLLDLGDLIRKPVRNLSLGERMKCEVAAALLHQPRVLFLDEPTIGLDVPMQRRIRSFLREYNRRYEATVLLTSHYMADVEALCKRVVVIHHGSLLFDGDLAALVEQFSPYKTISFVHDDDQADFSAYGQFAHSVDGRASIKVSKSEVGNVTQSILQRYAVTDLLIEDPPIDDVIDQVFTERTP